MEGPAGIESDLGLEKTPDRTLQGDVHGEAKIDEAIAEGHPIH